MASNITLWLGSSRRDIVLQSLACFGIMERRQADEGDTRQAKEHRTRAAEADRIRRLIEPETPQRQQGEVDHGTRVDLDQQQWFVLTEALELWADLRELRGDTDGLIETARDLVDEVDRQLDGRDRRRMQREATRKLDPR